MVVKAQRHSHQELDIHSLFADTMNAGGSTYGLMVQRAALAIRQGLTDSVLCLGAGKFPKVGTGGAEAVACMVSHEIYEFSYGPFSRDLRPGRQSAYARIRHHGATIG